ncbi:MAG: tRNA (adenosine(37)-N6)-threonylcarbamoyltransferase complex dimerization subunit type 1 TsaB [Acidobacteriota bacterium]|jgi:tRNA threonylcarbamoyladenosine biosynthesis protein TsaB|nr:tRNA (adenosine(37)-N6)-threonylcarbamoyltransferase complex dimerization subunit type 1 TsaB [Acidobacteriota bacterium]
MNQNHKILAFDTSSERGSVALLEGDTLRAELRSNAATGHSALLLEAADFILRRAGLTLKDLTLIAAGIGPGSFTGIRIGVATGIGLAQSLGIPFAGVSGLDVLARRAAQINSGRICVLLDARRGQFYFCEYEGKNGRLRRLCRPALIEVSDVKDHLANAVWITGDLNKDQVRETGKSFPRHARWIPVDLFLAEGIGRLGLERKRTWRSGDFITAEPLYIRPPDAVRNKAAARRPVASG